MIKKEYGNIAYFKFFLLRQMWKKLAAMNLSWHKDKIAYADDEKIKEVLQKKWKRMRLAIAVDVENPFIYDKHRIHEGERA